MMRGTKRFAGWDSNQISNESAFQSKRVLVGSPSDTNRAEPSQNQQQLTSSPLDTQRAELARQHVRALNAQFAGWIQTQLQNHPDELWEDGVHDYLNHASDIMGKFCDVVNWLKENAVKGESGSVSNSVQKNLVSVSKGTDKPGIPLPSTTGIFGNSRGSGAQKDMQSERKEIVSKSPSDKSDNDVPGTTVSNENNKLLNGGSGIGIFGSSWSSGTQRNFVSESKELDYKSSSGKADNAPAGTTASFGSSWSSGISFTNKSPFSFGIQSSVAASQNSIPVTNNASSEVDGEDDVEQPSSPSVRKTEEKGILVVHEVKCKLYVKSTDPADKGAWKDKGAGQLSIKCKDGFSKGTKESKPTIVVRNDVGKVLLNALLYPGIKTTNMKKNAFVAIFHTSGDGDNSVVARTFLIKTKAEEDRDKLVAIIEEYAPAT